MTTRHHIRSILFLLILAATQFACGGGSDDGGSDPIAAPPSAPPATTPPADDDDDDTLPPVGSKGVIFVAQTPNPTGTSDIGTHTATFGNSTPSISAAPRGGSLMLLRPDGELVDLLDTALRNGCETGGDAICDADGVMQVDADGLLVSGYVARRPRIHWDADRVIFAMTMGAKETQHGDVLPGAPLWQLYEITGLDPDDTPIMTRVQNQPDYNNVDPVYGSNGRIFFVSDQPVTGNPLHYPQLDEYESLPINSGLWRLDPVSGEIMLMDHSPSGDFGPEITPSGQVIFTRWDHLQQDQQSIDNSVAAVITDREDFWEAYTYADENDFGVASYTLVSDFVTNTLTDWQNTGDDSLLHVAASGMEIFPETVRGNPFYNWGNKEGTVAGTFNGDEIDFAIPATEFGAYNPLRFNHFLPWQIRQDGLQCETYRHTGLHENGGFIEKALRDDPLIETIETTTVRIPDGFFLNQVHDDTETGNEIVTGVVAPEFGTHKAGRILQFIDTQSVSKPALHENGDAVEYRFLTDPDDFSVLYRDPIYLSDGRLIAAVADNPEGDDRSFEAFDFRLFVLEKNPATGFHEPATPLLQDRIEKSFAFWVENGGLGLQEFNGPMWEFEVQEIIERTDPGVPSAPVTEAPELAAFAAAGVDPVDFHNYLEANNLAAIVVRNATSRDEADITQPFNLVVKLPDGTEGEQTVRTDFNPLTSQLYPITYLQLMRGDYLRGYEARAEFESGNLVDDGGRRVLPNSLDMTGKLAHNLDVEAGALPGSVPVQADGSIAALVPAHRALTWQTTDDDGDPVVRERYWLTFQPGEVRVCASCHGVNDRGQDGNTKPDNTPLALQLLLEELKDAGEL